MVSMPAPTVWVNGTQADPSHIPLPIVVVQGRARPDAQPDAPSLVMEWAEPSTCPVIGDRVELRAGVPAPSAPVWDDPRIGYDSPFVTYGGTATTYTRFTGIVADLDMQETHPGPATARLTAVGRLADLGRVQVTISRPAENDIARVQAICTAASVPVKVTGAAGPQLAANSIDRSALEALHEVTISSGGLVWSDPEGDTVRYGTGHHRESTTSAQVLPSGSVVDGVRWQTSATDMINHVTVKWGPEDSPSQTTVSDTAAIAEYGMYHVEVGSQLADDAAAAQLANMILARRAWPFWWITDVIVDSAAVQTPTDILTAARLRTSDTVLLAIPPAPGLVDEALHEWIVEGWVETWVQPDQVIYQFAVADRARWALTQLRTWGDAAAVTWADEARSSWADALILSPEEAAA